MEDHFNQSTYKHKRHFFLFHLSSSHHSGSSFELWPYWTHKKYSARKRLSVLAKRSVHDWWTSRVLFHCLGFYRQTYVSYLFVWKWNVHIFYLRNDKLKLKNMWINVCLVILHNCAIYRECVSLWCFVKHNFICFASLTRI
jgi:hypothetical protein